MGRQAAVLGLAGMFAYDLFLFADAMLFRLLDPDLWAARGFVHALVIPFAAVATARNTAWTIDLHLSRGVVFHSTALLVSGIYLLAMAAAGYYVRFFGGSWGGMLQVAFLFAALLLLALVVLSGQFRSRLRVFVSKHFFSYRYDYREEWLRFTRTLSTQSPHARAAGALHQGARRSGREPGRRALAAGPRCIPAGRALEHARGPRCRARRRRAARLSRAHRLGGRSAAVRRVPGAVSGARAARLARVAARGLADRAARRGSEFVGFVVLAQPRAPMEVDWEVRDLLKTASRQAASYLGQIRATEGCSRRASSTPSTACRRSSSTT